MATSTVALAPAIASTIEGFLEIRRAVVEVDPGDEIEEADIRTNARIPTDGDEGAFGYGILTKQSPGAVMVTTTHEGVLDSEEQNGDPNNPIFHNHYVKLVSDEDECGENNLRVDKITFESPGDVDIERRNAIMEDLPARFRGTDALTDDSLTLRPGTNVQDVVSFELDPHFDDDGNLEAVCVINIESADRVVVND
jgi:hypothetical protein